MGPVTNPYDEGCCQIVDQLPKFVTAKLYARMLAPQA